MSNFTLLSIQTSSAIAAYLVIYSVYLRGWFAKQSFERAVLPLLCLHMFRYLGLNLIVGGQIDSSVPRDALHVMAWGDYAAGFTAFVAAITVARGSKLGPLVVGLFTLVGVGDLINVGPTAWEAGVFQADIGAMWVILVVYAPALLLSHLYVAARLFERLRG